MNQNRVHSGVPAGGQFAEHNRSEGAVQLRPYADSTPAEVDVLLSTLNDERHRIEMRMDGLTRQIAQYREMDPMPSYYQSYVDRAEKELETLRPKRIKVLEEMRPLNEEYNARGGWTRFFLVRGSNGHVHSSTECSTCFPTTDFGWLAEHSGMNEAEIVELAGDSACTICYPTAPVADANNPRKNQLELPEVKAAREERAAAAAARAAKKEATGIKNPDGSELLDKARQNRDGSISFGRPIASERTAEIEAVGELVNLAWSRHWARQSPSATDTESIARAEVDAQLSKQFLDRTVTALANKRGQTEDEVRSVIEKKAAAKLKKEGLSL